MNLKTYFFENKINQSKLASKLGISQSQISLFVNDLTQLPDKHIESFCNAIGIDLYSFISGKIVVISELESMEDKNV